MGPGSRGGGEYHIDIPADDRRMLSDNTEFSREEAENRARDYLDRVPHNEEVPEVYIDGPEGRKLFNPKRGRE